MPITDLSDAICWGCGTVAQEILETPQGMLLHGGSIRCKMWEALILREVERNAESNA